jgi:hypothetical protein
LCPWKMPVHSTVWLGDWLTVCFLNPFWFFLYCDGSFRLVEFRALGTSGIMPFLILVLPSLQCSTCIPLSQ